MEWNKIIEKASKMKKTKISPLKASTEAVRPLAVVSVLPWGRFLASIFSTLSCFLPFSLVLHTTILSETEATIGEKMLATSFSLLRIWWRVNGQSPNSPSYLPTDSMSNRNRKLLISRAPTKAMSQGPAYLPALNQNKIDGVLSWDGGRIMGKTMN